MLREGPHHFDANLDPDPADACHFYAGPDPAFHFDPDPTPDPTFHFDPDLDPSFQIKA